MDTNFDPKLDPQAQALLTQFAEVPPPQGYEELRATMRMITFLAGEPETVTSVEDRSIPGPAGEIPVRIYKPKEENDLPILVYFHGGGFVAGDLETTDIPLRALANRSGCLIVSIDYRLAPENPYPAAPDDCYAATVWVAEHAAELGGDASRMAVGGDSAGGNLTAVISQRARDRGGPPLAYQVLIYPAVDATMSYPSVREIGDKGYVLSTEGMVGYVRAYLPDTNDHKNPDASPLFAPDLSGLPPALVITAGFDPLHDEGVAYAERLREAGVPVTHTCYEGMVHGFFQMGAVLEKGKEVINQIADSLKTALAK